MIQEQEGTGNDATGTPTTSVGARSAVYTAAVRGNLDGPSAATTLQLRVKECTANHVILKNGSNCIVQQIP